jgi:hypothetical protein
MVVSDGDDSDGDAINVSATTAFADIKRDVVGFSYTVVKSEEYSRNSYYRVVKTSFPNKGAMLHPT